MSIGLGIVLAALIVVIAWQVDKRGAWGKFRKAALWSGGLLIVAVGLFVTYLWWDGTSHEREQAAEVRKVRAGEFRTYWGITLGTDAKVVEYLKGDPAGDPIDLPKEGTVGWNYEVPDAADPPGTAASGAYVVWMSKQGRVEAIQCYVSSANYCEGIGGVGSTSSERDIIEKFGEPQRGPRIGHGTKELGYGNAGGSVVFSLEQDRVRMIHVGGDESGWFIDLQKLRLRPSREPPISQPSRQICATTLGAAGGTCRAWIPTTFCPSWHGG